MNSYMAAVLIGVGLLLASFAKIAVAQKNTPVAPPTSATPVEAPKTDFDKTGPQPGEQVPDLHLHTMKGEEQRLSAAWEGGPALLVTSSLTCPKSRSRWPELKSLVEKYEDKLNVVIVYVIEAHPVGSPCPYKGVEDITPENQRDGILRKQPKSLEDRLELAAEFKRLLRVSTPVYVDNIKDEAWKGLGAAPNLALLVDQEGKVVSRSGWFEGKKTEEAIVKFLAASKPKLDDDSGREQSERIYAKLKDAGIETFSLHWELRDKKSDLLARMLKAVPESVDLVIESQKGHPSETTLLMDAVQRRNAAAVKLLLENGADVKARTGSYESAFQIAAEEGDVPIAKMLLANGADPTVPSTGKSPLHQAALQGHTDFVALLFSTGLRHDLYSAIAGGEIEMVRKGLQADASRAFRPDGAGRMPLDYAAANGRLEIAKLLLDHRAPVIRDERSRTDQPLHRAIKRNDAAMVELLLAAGTSANTVVSGGEYYSQLPLHLAVGAKNLAIVKLLLQYKADIKARNDYSETALHAAASAGQAEIAAALIQAGADVNAPQLGFVTGCGPPGQGRPRHTTPLHFAAGSNSPATIKVLLAAGAKINAVTDKGMTPLMRAVYSQGYVEEQKESYLSSIDLLITSGADVNALNREGKSVLEIAQATHNEDRSPRSKHDYDELITLLKKHGAKLGAPKVQPPAPQGAAEVDPFG